MSYDPRASRTPKHGDVLVRAAGAAGYGVSTVPGDDQFSCMTRGAAEQLAQSCARRAHVDVWFSDRAGDFVPVARFRGLRAALALSQA